MTNFNDSNPVFIRCLAPTLCRIKPANLFTVPLSDYTEEASSRWQNMLKAQNLEFVCFRISETRVMCISYNYAWIRQILSDAAIQAYLRGKGYSDPLDLTATLNELFDRLKGGDGFPHEVGLILGYPFADVVGFEENEGRNCKCCSYWKSYSDPAAAQKCCLQYKRCSQMCRQWFEEGLSVPQIIQKYKEAVKNAA